MNIWKKIIILGCPGSGKSTLARALHEITAIPLYHLDNIWWNPDQTHVSRDVFDERLQQLLEKDSWIIDGDYSRTYEVRIRNCDTVIFLDLSEQECLEGIIHRAGYKRSDLPWIESYDDASELAESAKTYRSNKRPVVNSLLDRYSYKNIIRLSSRQQVNDWLKQLTEQYRKNMTDIFEYLKKNSYPGRGIIAGYHQGSEVIAYFIMGRSANSRNRIFVKDNGTLFTRAFDESKVADPSLIIYNAIREYGDRTIVTNGDHTDTIYEYLEKGLGFADALNTREYEPDAPNYTARISCLIGSDEFNMAILKEKEGICQREYYRYPKQDNQGRFISTYLHDGNPLPCFEGEPLEMEINEDFEEFADKLWNSLNEDNKISLYVRFGDRERIYNKNKE